MSGDFLDTLRPVLDWILRTTWEASVIAALVLLAQHLLRGRVSARWRYNLWLLVVARLLLPSVPGTALSPFNLVQLPQPAGQPAPTTAPQWQPVPPARLIPVPGSTEELRGRHELYLASDTGPEVPIETTIGVGPADALLGMLAAGTPTASPSDDRVSIVTPPPAPAGAKLRQIGAAAHARTHATPQRQLASGARPFAGPAFAAPSAASLSAVVPPWPAPDPWRRRVNWLAVVAIVWVAGVAFVAARLAWVSWRLSAALRGLRPARDPALASLLAECAAQLRLRRLPEVLEAPGALGPVLVGMLRPRVVLPGCVLRGSFGREELRLILMHEMAHMKRRDVAANWLLAVLGALHWFNPVLSFAFRRMRADRELACDELVLSAAAPGADRTYGPTLLKLIQTLARRSAVPGMVGVLEGTTPLSRRITMIARFDRSNRNPSPLVGVALSVLAGGVALTGAVRGQDSPVAPSKAEVREPAGVSPAPVAAPPAAPVPPLAALPATTPEEAAAGLSPKVETEIHSDPEYIFLRKAVDGIDAELLAQASLGGETKGMEQLRRKKRLLESKVRQRRQDLILAINNGPVALAPPPAVGPEPDGTPEQESARLHAQRVVIDLGPEADATPQGSARAGGRPGYPGAYGRSAYSGMPYGSGGEYGAVPYGYRGMGGMPGAVPGYPGMPARMGGAMPAGRVEEPSARRADAQAAEALRKSLPVQFDNVPLEEALRNVADSTGVDVIVDAKSLETAGVDRNAPVTLTLRQGAPAEQVLTWLLHSAGGDAIGYALDHGVVVVASQDRIDRMVITRAYPVAGNGGNGVAELVRDTISPQSWREYGGAGTVRFFGRQLFVTANEPTHRQVERLLGLMEAHGAGVPADGGGMMPGLPGGMRPGMSGAPAPAAPRPGPAR